METCSRCGHAGAPAWRDIRPHLVIGFFALTQIEFNLASLAAVLAVPAAATAQGLSLTYKLDPVAISLERRTHAAGLLDPDATACLVRANGVRGEPRLLVLAHEELRRAPGEGCEVDL